MAGSISARLRYKARHLLQRRHLPRLLQRHRHRQLLRRQRLQLQLLQHLLLRRARVQPLGNPHTDVDANGHCNSQRNTNTDSYSEIYSYIQAAPISTTSADPAVEKAVIFWEHRLPACPFRQPAEKRFARWQPKSPRARWAVVGKLPATTG